ncbi:hypothetical protein PQR62_03085 [Herbaspirillum lusitanum]|uniref:Uncharacterized protein n=1 Tax=Herbaspirillum lusitanum TaxID=213312 RepID=A0ABW9A5N3_9BURK
MFSTRNLILALGVSSMAVASVLGLCASRMRRRERRLQRQELQRWEGEGGNLPPVAARPPLQAER